MRLPPELVAQHQPDLEALHRAKIIPGAVIRLSSALTNPPKPKRFLVVGTAPLLLFIINTDIPKFYQNYQKRALEFQIKVQPDGTCFDNECHIDCSKFWDEFDFEDILQSCLGNTCEVLGNIADKVCTEVCDAVIDCNTFTPPERNAINGNLAR